MASAVDQTVLQRTRDTLGKLIKKPPLTDKLLNRPPFRYLHDIVKEIIGSTGFYDGLYSADELDAKNLQDRDSKIAFLQKAIDVLSFTTGEIIRVRSSKIVAGHEAEKTNEFLQLLSIAILKQQPSTEAVQRVLNGEKPSEALGKDKKKRPQEAKSEDDSKKGKEQKGGGGGKESDGERAGREERGREGKRNRERHQSGSSRTRTEAGSKDGSSVQKQRGEEGGGSGERPKHRPSRTRLQQASDSELHSSQEALAPPPPSTNHVGGGGGGERGGEGGGGGSDGGGGGGSEVALDRPSSARGGKRKKRSRDEPPSDKPSASAAEASHSSTVEDMGGPEAHLVSTATRSPSPPPLPPSVGIVPTTRRPSSARPAPPKIIKQKLLSEEVDSRVPSGTTAAPPTIILDNVDEDEEEEEGEEGGGGGGGGGGGEMEGGGGGGFVIDDPAKPNTLSSTTNNVFQQEKVTEGKAEGTLTKTILATKERLEGGLPKEQEQSLYAGISDAQRRKEREMVAKEINKLQSSIQTLCQSANPLGKIMDYVQEDVDSMLKELESWRSENTGHADTLRKEERITEQELLPLKSQLGELEARIVEQEELISATKANVLRNDHKIQAMLDSMAFPSS